MQIKGKTLLYVGVGLGALGFVQPALAQEPTQQEEKSTSIIGWLGEIAHGVIKGADKILDYPLEHPLKGKPLNWKGPQGTHDSTAYNRYQASRKSLEARIRRDSETPLVYAGAVQPSFAAPNLPAQRNTHLAPVNNSGTAILQVPKDAVLGIGEDTTPLQDANTPFGDVGTATLSGTPAKAIERKNWAEQQKDIFTESCKNFEGVYTTEAAEIQTSAKNIHKGAVYAARDKFESTTRPLVQECYDAAENFPTMFNAKLAEASKKKGRKGKDPASKFRRKAARHMKDISIIPDVAIQGAYSPEALCNKVTTYVGETSGAAKRFEEVIKLCSSYVSKSANSKSGLDREVEKLHKKVNAGTESSSFYNRLDAAVEVFGKAVDEAYK